MARLDETRVYIVIFAQKEIQPSEILSAITFNILGSIAYVAASSEGWRIPEEHGIIPISGEPFAWFGSILPVVTSFLLLN